MKETIDIYEEMCRLEESSPGQDEEQMLDETLLEGANAVDLPLTDLPVVDPPNVENSLVYPTTDTSTLDPPVN